MGSGWHFRVKETNRCIRSVRDITGNGLVAVVAHCFLSEKDKYEWEGRSSANIHNIT